MKQFYIFITILLCIIGNALYITNLIKQWDALTADGVAGRIIIFIIMLIFTIVISYVLSDVIPK